MSSRDDPVVEIGALGEQRLRARTDARGLRILADRIAPEVVDLQRQVDRPGRVAAQVPGARSVEHDNVAGLVVELHLARLGEHDLRRLGRRQVPAQAGSC